MQVYDVRERSQERARPDGGELASDDRRLCLGALLRALHYRYRRGKPVRWDDLRQLLTLADDAHGPHPTPGGHA
jgi:hypothetical protein